MLTARTAVSCFIIVAVLSPLLIARCVYPVGRAASGRVLFPILLLLLEECQTQLILLLLFVGHLIFDGAFRVRFIFIVILTIVYFFVIVVNGAYDRGSEVWSPRQLHRRPLFLLNLLFLIFLVLLE